MLCFVCERGLMFKQLGYLYNNYSTPTLASDLSNLHFNELDVISAHFIACDNTIYNLHQEIHLACDYL
jgi:hypothetical protein